MPPCSPFPCIRSGSHISSLVQSPSHWLSGFPASSLFLPLLVSLSKPFTLLFMQQGFSPQWNNPPFSSAPFFAQNFAFVLQNLDMG